MALSSGAWRSSTSSPSRSGPARPPPGPCFPCSGGRPPRPEVRPARRPVPDAETQRANRRDWDAYADEYQATHGAFLGDVGFVWCPEGVQEADARVLGDVAGRRVLEVGCGAGQCARWLTTQGARAVGLDLSVRQLQHSRRIDEETRVEVPVVAGTATALPFDDDTFD